MSANSRGILYPRRRFLVRLGAGAAAIATARLFERGAFAERLEDTRVRTPALEEGPFYPDKLPLDTDNDLLIVNDSITPAVGEVTHLTGRILDLRGDPVRNAVIEIWQVDNTGSYIHSHGANPRAKGRPDPNFQGYGRFLTGSTGEYYFRTIKPVEYPGRTPHIHARVSVKGREELTTQFFIKGHPLNDRDGVLGNVGSYTERQTIIAEYVPLIGSQAGELAVRYEVVLGLTPRA